MGDICFQNLLSDNCFSSRGDASLIFLNGSFIRYLDAGWNKKLMKIWWSKITHENQNWMKIWPSMDLTLWIFFKTNFFSLLSYFFSLIWTQNNCLSPSAYFDRLNNQNNRSIEIQKKMEEFGEKMKTHVSKISLGSRPQSSPQGRQRVTMNSRDSPPLSDLNILILFPVWLSTRGLNSLNRVNSSPLVFRK